MKAAFNARALITTQRVEYSKVFCRRHSSPSSHESIQTTLRACSATTNLFGRFFGAALCFSCFSRRAINYGPVKNWKLSRKSCKNQFVQNNWANSGDQSGKKMYQKFLEEKRHFQPNMIWNNAVHFAFKVKWNGFVCVQGPRKRMREALPALRRSKERGRKGASGAIVFIHLFLKTHSFDRIIFVSVSRLCSVFLFSCRVKRAATNTIRQWKMHTKWNNFIASSNLTILVFAIRLNFTYTRIYAYEYAGMASLLLRRCRIQFCCVFGISRPFSMRVDEPYILLEFLFAFNFSLLLRHIEFPPGSGRRERIQFWITFLFAQQIVCFLLTNLITALWMRAFIRWQRFHAQIKTSVEIQLYFWYQHSHKDHKNHLNAISQFKNSWANHNFRGPSSAKWFNFKSNELNFHSQKIY